MAPRVITAVGESLELPAHEETAGLYFLFDVVAFDLEIFLDVSIPDF